MASGESCVRGLSVSRCQCRGYCPRSDTTPHERDGRAPLGGVRERAGTYGIVAGCLQVCKFVGPGCPLGHAPGCVPSSSRAAMFVHDRLASKAVPSHVKPAIAVDVTIMPAGSGLDATHVVVTVSSVRLGALPERQAEGLCSPFSACATAAPAATQWAVPGGSGSEAAAAAAAAGLGGA